VAAPSTDLVRLEDLARSYLSRSRAENTVKAYRSDWADFTRWCKRHGRDALPADPVTVALYVTDMAEDRATSTIRRRLSSIAVAHRLGGFDPPTAAPQVKELWAGVRRTKGTSMKAAEPLVTHDIARLVHSLPDDLSGARDRAFLLVGFAAALRGSELVALDVDDIAAVDEGLVLSVRRSKTDPESEGRKIGIPYGTHESTCPVRALQAWIDAAEISDGPLFRSVNRHGQASDRRLSVRAVSLVVKRAAERAGLDPILYSGHSLRAGFATAAAQAGVPERQIMDQTGHRSLPVLRR